MNFRSFSKALVVTALAVLAVPSTQTAAREVDVISTGSVPPASGTQEANVSATQTISGRTGDVYILRGLMDVFSRGMDTLAVKLSDKGFSVQVLNHSSWTQIVPKIVERYKATRNPEPVFLIGHSLGADAVILIAERLAENKVPVSLAVTFDPVHPRQAPPNVKRFINFYQSNNGWGTPVAPAPGAPKALVNEDFKDRTDISHTTIDKADFLHSKVVDEMVRMSRPVRRRVAG